MSKSFHFRGRFTSLSGYGYHDNKSYIYKIRHENDHSDGRRGKID